MTENKELDEGKHIPVFKTWRGWYIAVLVAQVVGILIFYILTNTFHPH